MRNFILAGTLVAGIAGAAGVALASSHEIGLGGEAPLGKETSFLNDGRAAKGDETREFKREYRGYETGLSVSIDERSGLKAGREAGEAFGTEEPGDD